MLNAVFTELLSKNRGWRPHFVWGVVQGAHLARALGIKRISVIEFGVAGGNGLICLEQVAAGVERALDIKIDVYGFDTGGGLPPPKDHRDLPNLWTERAFPMDAAELRGRLKKARLVLGLVKETIGQFVDARPHPVAFISFDLDYYSSTMEAFELLDAEKELLLPRVYCYFDDILGFTYSDFAGERLAIADFNASHRLRKISPIYGLRYFLPAPYDQARWNEMMFIAHLFDHDLYGRYDGLVKSYVGSGTDLKPAGGALHGRTNGASSGREQPAAALLKAVFSR
jgi:hypothetical protein